MQFKPQKIKDVRAVYNISPVSDKRWVSGDGYLIETEELKIYLIIDNCQSCCENWGYATSEDDLNKFIGATLVSYYVTDTALNTNTNIEMFDGDIIFVTFCTDMGPLQLVVYNEHNGYYGHTALLIVNDKVELDTIL